MPDNRKGEYFLSVIKQHRTLKTVQAVYPFLKNLLENKNLTFRANNKDGTCYIDALGTSEYYNIIAVLETPDEYGSIQLYARLGNNEPISVTGTEHIKEFLNATKYGERYAIQY